jgi:two-component system heavy metal sensor histidine kinase CusS
MKSIGARLAICYVLASTVTFASLFITGRYFIERHAIHALDLLNQSEFEQLKSGLGPLGETFPKEVLLTRVHALTDDLKLIHIEVDSPTDEVIFRSEDMDGHRIPARAPGVGFNVVLDGLGELRASTFVLGPYKVTIATSKSQVRVVMAGYARTFYELLIVMIVVSSVIGYGFGRMALRPLRTIQETANRIRSDNLSERIPVSTAKDEISDLARLLNQMFDRLETSFDQIRRFTAEASHELKTPLTLVRLQAEKLLMDGQLLPTQEQSVQIQLKELAHLNRIIGDLLLLSRADAHALTLDLKLQDPEPFLHSFAEDAHVLAEHKNLRFFLTHHGHGRVAIETKWLRQVLLNLLSNALSASPPGGRVTLRSTLMDGLWQVSIEDEGLGIPVEQRERIFERFVRISRPGDEKGTGLGLAICRSLVELHGGRIFAESAPGGCGLRMVFEITAATAADGSEAASRDIPLREADAT